MVDLSADDLWIDFKLTDNRQLSAGGIFNRHVLSQLHVDQVTHGDRGAEISQPSFFDQSELGKARILERWEHESLDRHELTVKFGQCIRNLFDMLG